MFIAHEWRVATSASEHAIGGWQVRFCDDVVGFARDADAARGFSTALSVPKGETTLSMLARRPGFCIGWTRDADGAETLYFFDRDHDGVGYALNLDQPSLSAWGAAPFAMEDAG